MTEAISSEMLAQWKTNRELVKAIIHKQVTYNLIFGHFEDSGAIDKQLAIAHIMVLPTVALVIRLEGGRQGFQPKDEFILDRVRVFKKLERLLDNNQEALIAIMGRNNVLAALVGDRDIVLLVPIAEINSKEEVNLVPKRYANYIKAYLEKDADFVVAIGIGNRYDDFRQLRNSYEEACAALAYSFYRPSGAIHHIADLQKVNRRDTWQLFIANEALLLERMRKGEWDEFYRISQRLVATITQDNFLPPDVLKVRMLELFTLLSRVAIDMGGDTTKLLDLKVRVGNEIQGTTNVKEFINCVGDAFRDISWFVQDCQGNPAAKAITKAKQYIYANYTKNISLEELAHYALLSPYYLSHAFSVTCGVTITEYLKKVRIHKAQAMLSSTNRSVAAIAASVGYNDPNYFARVFKSLTGKSPHQYRKGILADLV